MKKLLFAASALAALSLLTPSAGFAQFHDYDNTVGIFLDEDATQTEKLDGLANVPFFVYIVLLRPATLDGSGYPDVNAFELTINSSDNTIFKLAEGLPAGAINVGDATVVANGLEYIVGLANSISVDQQAVTLFSLQLMSLTGNPFELFVGPTSKPSIDGEMAFQSVSPILIPMFSSAGAPGSAVFGFNTGVVAIESETWGGVKSLYR